MHSLKKGTLTITKFIAKVQNTSAPLEASRSVVSEAKKVKVIIAGLSFDFDTVLTLASFSLETLPFQLLVDVQMEFENRQTQAVQDVPIYVNLAEASPALAVTEFALRPRCSGRFSTGSRGRNFCPQMQC